MDLAIEIYRASAAFPADERALGSQTEVEVQLELAHRLGFMTATEYAALQQRDVIVGRMLHRLVESLRAAKPGEH